MKPFPWQHALWRQIIDLADRNRFPHALMLSGAGGLGKEQFAKALTARMLCRTPGEFACGECRSCRMLTAGHHPNLLTIEPAEKGRLIRVDSVREANDFVAQTAQQGGYRVIYLQPAEGMTIAAANALLKSLEEPGSNTLFILLADIPSRALPTIRSRCQRWTFAIPDEAECLPWLREKLGNDEDARFWWRVAGGQPLLAVELGQGESRQLRQTLREVFEALVRGAEPVAEAARIDRQALSSVLWYGIAWLEDLIRLGLSGETAQIRNSDLLPLYRQAVKNGRVRDWFRLLDYAREQRRLLAAGSNPNAQLVLESWLVRWAALLRS